jgi:DNA-directed RNA polymerase subunit RPC12/RpoP
MGDTENTSNAPVIKKLRCTRCGREWYPRTLKKPDVCPTCKSRYWDRPRRKEKKTQQAEEKLVFPEMPCCKADQADQNENK